MGNNIHWTIGSFNELSKNDLYAMVKLRVDVFVVEQNCAYNEIDGQDDIDSTLHYLGRCDGEICCYARKLAAIEGSEAVRIGRVVVANKYRGAGLASILLKKLIHL